MSWSLVECLFFLDHVGGGHPAEKRFDRVGILNSQFGLTGESI
ncbi:hypothetical protein [Nitrospira sp. Ecomares 2.1]